MLQWNLPSLISLQAEGPLSDTSILAVTKALEVKHLSLSLSLSLSVKSPCALVSWPCFMHEFLLMQCKRKEVRDLFWKKNFFVECCWKWNSLPFLQHAKATVSESWWWAEDQFCNGMEKEYLQWKTSYCSMDFLGPRACDAANNTLLSWTLFKFQLTQNPENYETLETCNM